MALTEAETGRMEEAAANIEEAARRLGATAEKVRLICGELDAMWDGEAGMKSKNALGSRCEQFASTTNALTAYAEALRRSISIYVKADSEAADIVKARLFR